MSQRTHRIKQILVLGIILILSVFLTGADLHAETFASRCQTQGVIKCVGFDASSEIDPFYSPSGGGKVLGTLDTAIKASGAGSLRFEIPPFTGANAAGSWRSSFGQGFGPGQTFYVQFRQRFSQSMLTFDSGGDGWKQVIFHNHQKTCSNVELTTQNINYQKFPIMYSNCGSKPLRIQIGQDFLLQQGDYNCRYLNTDDCSYYVADQWMTFYYQVTLGNWNQPESTINAWVAYENQPMKQWIQITNFTLNSNLDWLYDMVTLLPYITGKDSTINHPTAYTWYDELIVSTQPIPAPDGSTSGGSSDVEPPSPPSGLNIS